MVICVCGDFLMPAGGCNKACVISPAQIEEKLERSRFDADNASWAANIRS